MSDRRCKRCVLPDSFPGIRFNEEGICSYCTEAGSGKSFLELKNEVEGFVRSKVGHSAQYDVVLAFSGGKDSTYTLKYLKETFSARIVAITIDNGFISERAYANCRNIPEHLGVDHIFIKPNPKALLEVYKKSEESQLHSVAALKRASAICNSCIQVINTQILNFASNFGIPIVAGGYIGGQIPSDTGLMVQNMKVTKKVRRHFIDVASAKLSQDALKLFQLSAHDQDIAVINPMIYLNLSEEEIIEDIKTIGWEKPQDTGASSTNCRLNDFAIHQHMKNHSYHPYILEIANMVRHNKMNRDEALKKITVSFDDRDFSEIRTKLEKYL